MKIQNRQQFLIVLAAIAFALLIGNSLVYEPLVKLWKARQAKGAELRQEVGNGKMLLRRESSIRSRWADIRTNALPNDASLSEEQVLKAIDNWARQSGATVSSVTPQWQNDEDDYSTLDCRLEASGDLQTLSRFLYQIENDPMTLQLNSVELTANDSHGQELTLGLEISGLALISPQP